MVNGCVGGAARAPVSPCVVYPDVVGEVVIGDEEFGGGMDSDSFVAQLRADEAALEEANKFLLVSYPP